MLPSLQSLDWAGFKHFSISSRSQLASVQGCKWGVSPLSCLAWSWSFLPTLITFPSTLGLALICPHREGWEGDKTSDSICSLLASLTSNAQWDVGPVGVVLTRLKLPPSLKSVTQCSLPCSPWTIKLSPKIILVNSGCLKCLNTGRHPEPRAPRDIVFRNGQLFTSITNWSCPSFS